MFCGTRSLPNWKETAGALGALCADFVSHTPLSSATLGRLGSGGSLVESPAVLASVLGGSLSHFPWSWPSQ
eukprot:5262908-Amphidinium_carterae.1